MTDQQQEGSGWVKDLAHEFFQACLAFYDKSPIIGGVGFLLLVGTVPLFFILRAFTKMRRIDNELVVSKLRLELANKAKSRKGSKKSKVARPAASTTTTTGG